MRKPVVVLSACLTSICAALAVCVLAASPASASRGTLGKDVQAYLFTMQTSGSRLVSTGWATDVRGGKPGKQVKVRMIVGKATKTVTADRRHASLAHSNLNVNSGFRITATLTPGKHTVCVYVVQPITELGCRVVTITNPGAKVAAVARQQVGKRYVYGAASPSSGFDCSGLAMYSYRKGAHVALPHSSEAQYEKARRISRADARPGDLVFFHGGGGVYHVAVYAGGGKVYEASTPRTGVVYRKIWAKNVTFGTFLHR